MNDGNIKYYLEQEMNELKHKIKSREDWIEENEHNIAGHVKMLHNLKVHYTSLLNTAIAYGYEVEEDEQDDKT